MLNGGLIFKARNLSLKWLQKSFLSSVVTGAPMLYRFTYVRSKSRRKF
jgi:hypothetical protein